MDQRIVMQNTVTCHSSEHIHSLPHHPEVKKRYKSKPLANTILSYTIYFKDAVDLHKYRVDELKKLAKYHRLHITGNKPTLIGRIDTHFRQTVCVVRIQSMVRGYAVRRALRLRGPAVYDRHLCTNDTDFFQLEPLDEIPPELFFSYTDSDEENRGGTFVYGFHLHSLVLHYLKKYASLPPYRSAFDIEMVTNPYNRRSFPWEVVRDIFAAYQYVRIMCPAQRLDPDHAFREMYFKFTVAFREHRMEPTHVPPVNLLNMATVTRTSSSLRSPIPNGTVLHWVETRPSGFSMAATLDATRQRMEEIRQSTLTNRITQLFMEMDHLGNYTNSEWFTSLTRRECLVFYEQLSELWQFRAQIPQTIKMRICPLGNPLFLSMPDQWRPSEISTNVLVNGCLAVMENMVFTGLDDEYRKLGALHVLTALTTVSLPARNSMIWLYESIM